MPRKRVAFFLMSVMMVLPDFDFLAIVFYDLSKTAKVYAPILGLPAGV